uniref:Uncharacterized protein n=1 Tax=Rhizophora mucronata TaxID=61149 RepID=A0A2P2Q8I4_RHIMU
MMLFIEIIYPVKHELSANYYVQFSR